MHYSIRRRSNGYWYATPSNVEAYGIVVHATLIDLLEVLHSIGASFSFAQNLASSDTYR